MIFQINTFLTTLSQLAALFILLLGVIWIIYGLYEAFRRKSFRKLTKVEDWDFDITTFLKVLTILGFVVGIFSILTGTAALLLDLPPSIAYSIKTANEANLFTSIFLIVLGLLTFLKPLNDLPIASIIGLAVATFVTVFVASLIQEIPAGVMEFIGGYVDIRILLIVIFCIIFAIVALTVKFYTAAVMFVAKIISWPPFAFILAGFCFVQSFALLIFGISIF